MASLDNRSILVTGGTGSFGQAFIKRLLSQHKPARVVVYSRDELKQFEMQQVIQAPQLRYFIGDVRDEDRLHRAFADIDTVVHAAAMKQIVASEYNPIECIKTNVMGAENIVNAAIHAGVRRVLALSTDKAVNPINLYGATKLCSDKLFIAANHLSGTSGPRFSLVRYGNVIGSRGSVVPLFREKRKSGVIPITDPRMTRFWLTLDYGCSFVERCLGMMRGGEVFIPKIASMRVADLATAVAPECRQEIIGIRAGEKLHEVLMPRDEARHALEFDDFYIIRPPMHLWDYDESAVYGDATGSAVCENFEYASDNNDRWISIEQLRAFAE
jgi:UDP-N-acetylglucosamine 4,6-dehydratase/5-epimerase